MLYDEKPKYCYSDVEIVPAVISNKSSRSECNLPDTLPLFTAPMDNVVGVESYDLYKKNGIIPILPRPVNLQTRLKNSDGWSAYGLKEFEEYFCDHTKTLVNRHALIDVANGHMKIIYDLVKKAKSIWGDVLVVMVGNIANPKTYEIAEKAGADYIRVGIGGGKGCFVSGTMVTMADGTMKPIECVRVGEEVITHLGNTKKVIDTLNLVSENNLLKINDDIICTENHKFLVINTSDIDKITDDNLMEFAYWVCANELDKNLHTLVKSNFETCM